MILSTRIALWSVLFAAASGCSPYGRDVSSTKEAPNADNNVSKIGLVGPFKWRDVAGPTAYSLDYTPWTDTYWPTYDKGLAYRFQETADAGLETFSLYTYLKKLFDAVEDQNSSAFAKFSPAEKHDLVLASDLTQFGELSRRRLLAAAKKIDKDARERLTDADSQPVAARVEAKIAAVRRAVNETSDLLTRGLATQLPLTTSSWLQWASVAGNARNQLHGDDLVIGDTNMIDPEARDWSWEGICHGWSPAAIYAKEPKHAVMAQKADGRKVLFTEGDIRGLLSKSWADHSGLAKAFIGGRCNVEAEDIQTDTFGRSLDGTVACKTNPSFPGCEADQAMGLNIAEELEFSGLPVLRVELWGAALGERFLVVRDRDRANNTIAYAFSSIVELKSWVRSGRPERATVSIQFQSQCRDVNPMTMHLLLTQYMTQGNGFVMDRTRSAQVWNQPVKGYKLEYVSIPGSSVAADEPTSISELSDTYWSYRAPNTKFLVQVRAALNWTTEKGPYVRYKRTVNGSVVDIDDTAVRTLTLEYTLELDADKQLIGGEWGFIPTDGQPSQPGSRNGPAPDFIYLYGAGSEPQPDRRAAVNYPDIVKKIHACSLDETSPLKDSELVDLTQSPVKYTECKL